MGRLHVSLGDVPSEVRCAKPACTVASHARLQRHHKDHPAMWLGIWASRRQGETRWVQFVKRYYEFQPEDVVLICDLHHAEIHSIYDQIINADRKKTNLTFSKYTWRQAEMLMLKLRKACDEWLQKETPGIDPRVYGETRAVYKAILRKRRRS